VQALSPQLLQSVLRGGGGFPQQTMQGLPQGSGPGTMPVNGQDGAIISRQLPDQQTGYINSQQGLSNILQMILRGQTQQSQRPPGLDNRNGLPPWVMN
jgi:hypothetical protein